MQPSSLAHDVYATLFNAWGAEIFSNIAASETEHTEAVLGQIELYGVDDPADGNPVGALIEETDIRDIREKMEATDETSILQVYQNLLCGS